MRAQQATTRSRRRSNVSQPANLLDIPWTLRLVDSFRVEIMFLSGQEDIQAEYPGLVITAPPKLTVDGDEWDWSIETVFPGSIILVSPDGLPLTALFRIFPYDPGVRSNLGGYLSPQITRGNLDQVMTAIGAEIIDENTIRVSFDTLGGMIGCVGGQGGYQPKGPVTTTPNAFASNGYKTVSATDVWVSFDDDISLETQVSIPGGNAFISDGLVGFDGEILDIT